MKFYFDESGNFQVPTNAGEHRVGIVSGILILESGEAEVFRQFDAFVAKLPVSAFQNGEPKGRLLDDEARKGLADMLVDLPGILLCPTMIVLTSLVGNAEADVVGSVVRKLRQVQAMCKYEKCREQVGELAREVEGMSPQQTLRLAAWAKCVSRAIHDSIIFYSDPRRHSLWNSVHFEIDPVETVPGNREERVFRTLLPAWVTGWSQNEPLTTIEGIHSEDHAFVKNWGCPGGIDVGKMFEHNVHYVSSARSKGIQLADMIATLVRRAVVGICNVGDLHNYGLMMTKTIGDPLHAIGLFSFAPVDLKDFERRYFGLPHAIAAARRSLPGSYARHQGRRPPPADTSKTLRTSSP